MIGGRTGVTPTCEAQRGRLEKRLLNIPEEEREGEGEEQNPLTNAVTKRVYRG